jgi:hypothetical protein
MHPDVNATLARSSADERRGAAVRRVPSRGAGARPPARRRRGPAALALLVKAVR